MHIIFMINVFVLPFGIPALMRLADLVGGTIYIILFAGIASSSGLVFLSGRNAAVPAVDSEKSGRTSFYS